MRAENITVFVTVCMILYGFGIAFGQNNNAEYEITVTNITKDQRFTPILVVTHSSEVSLFTAGAPASPELATLAEEGDTAPLAGLLQTLRGVRDVVSGSGLLNPGASITLNITGRGSSDKISVAAMLIPTNDAFVAVNGVKAPKQNRTEIVMAPAYDSGSEINDELCASIPGPDFSECGGPGGGGMPSGGEEGFVHIHSGIHGVGDFSSARRDWNNPVARVVIHRVN